MSKLVEHQKFQTAISLHQGGRLDKAAELYRQIISSNPKNVDALLYLGIIEATLGNHAQARGLLHRSLEGRLPSIEFVENCSTVLFQIGDYKSAYEAAERGLQISCDSLPLLYVSAISLCRLKQLDLAIQQFDKLLLLAPNHIAAINERGSVLAEMRKYKEALASFETALAFQPQYAEAHLNAGNVLGVLKRYDEALVAYEKALALNPALADAWIGRGNVFTALKRPDNAFAAYDGALALRPNSAGAWLGRGNVFSELQRHDEAFESYDKALALDPNSAEAWLGRGNVFVKLKRYEDSFAAYGKALALKPDLAEAWLGRGNAFIELRRYDEATADYDRAVALKPELVEAWIGRGNVYFVLSRYGDALTAYNKALTLNPNIDFVAGHRLLAKLHLCEWDDLEGEVAQLLSTVRTRKLSSRPFPILALPSSPADQLQCAMRLIQDQPPLPSSWRGEIYAHDRIRLAYLSADFHEHATAFLMAELFERHDRSRFEVTGLSFGPNQDSAMRQRIKAGFEHFEDVMSRSDQEVADIVRRLEIDIAIDLKGLTLYSRPGILARRGAPIQVNYLGYPGTTGASYIDYILADSIIIPEDQRAFYSEHVVWLPESYQINDRKRLISERTPSRRECGLPDGSFVFCAFNSSYKITPAIFDIWMRVLTTYENSVLWLLEGNPAASSNLRREADKRGVSSQRLIFGPRMPLADHLARHRNADLFLDTLPCNAHTTASDALWAGVPLLTCLGTTFAGRVAASLVNAVGLDELITRSMEDYEALALKLAREPSYLARIKAKLACNRDTFPLFDSERTARHIEAAYTTMWERYQKGYRPQAFAVGKLD